MEKKKFDVEFHGTNLFALVPLLLFVVFCILFFVVFKTFDMMHLCMGGYVALIIGSLLSKNWGKYWDAVATGMSSKIMNELALILLIVGMFGKLMTRGGVAQGFVWLGDKIGLSGGGFVAFTFIATCVIATATGTSIGTMFTAFPILYPSGLLLGADPVFLAKIAYENPEFGANVVANPRAYPGLKRWVAEFGDERARQQLVAMGWPVPQNGVQPQPIAEPTAQPMAEPVAEQVQPEQQYQPAVAEQFQQEQQYQPEQPVNQQYGQDAAYAASNEASTEYVDPYMNPADLSEVADYSSSQPQNEPEQQYAEQQYAAAQESPADAGFTAELAMTTTDQMLMARIASEAPELRPCLARNPYIYPELLAWLGQLNDSAINAAIRLRQQ